MRRIFLNISVNSVEKEVKLDKENLHYLKNVLRLPNETEILIFNGKNEFLAKLKKESVEILNVLPEKKETALKLAVSIIKKERLEFLVEKATELNVSEIFLLQCKFTQMHRFSFERLNKIAIEAAKQCKRCSIPTITQQTFKEFASKIDLNEWCMANMNGNMLEPFHPFKGIIIGPEGGFCESELNNFSKIKLGNNVLRTETAAIAGVALLNLKNLI